MYNGTCLVHVEDALEVHRCSVSIQVWFGLMLGPSKREIGAVLYKQKVDPHALHCKNVLRQ